MPPYLHDVYRDLKGLKNRSLNCCNSSITLTVTRCHKMMYETIPSELLCEIFQLLCDKPISLHILENSSCFGEFPWAVGQVCKRWREVFLSYPHLWTSLSLRYHGYSTEVSVDGLHEMSRRTLLYLERSKQLPLTITVGTSKYDGTSNSMENFPRTTWRLLLSCSERWERADLALCCEPNFFDLLRCKMSIIKSLRFHVESIHEQDFEVYYPFITAAPRLVELELLGWYEAWAFPWSQLTKVNISLTNGGFIFSTRLEKLFSQLPNVKELRMGKVDLFPRNDLRDKGSASHIRIASLQLLAVPIYPVGILTRMEAPLLEHLWVDGYPVYSKKRSRSLIFIEELSFFIRRSSCHIRRLTLQNSEWRLLSSLMKLLSSVEELCIKTTSAGRGSFLVEHITQMNDGVCLPNLRELEVTCLRGRGDDEKLMTAMSRLLETRRAESRLKSVSREDVPLEPASVRISMSFK